MGRPDQSAARRDQIVDALARVMAEHGYGGATVQLVAAEAGLAPGLVHYYFPDKLRILVALVERLAGHALARLDARLARAGESPARRLDAALDALLAVGDDADPEAAACWALIGAEAVLRSEVRAVYAAFLAEVTELLRGLLVATCHAERRSGEGAQAMAAALVVTVEGFFAVAAAVPAAVPRGSAASMAKRMAAGLVAAQPRR